MRELMKDCKAKKVKSPLRDKQLLNLGIRAIVEPKT